MTLTQMNYIITISETGSLNKAAEALYISQPSLTNAVKELEKELGIIIFNRSGRGVTLTNDGTEFLMYARQIYGQYESVVEKYSEGGSYKKKFGVSTQHYSFAVKAFVDMVQKFDVSEYEFAIRETKTADVISDVSTMKSEVGVLYLSDFNRKALLKLLHSANLEFHHLIDCQAYVYLWKNHPLANEKSISYSQLAKYPCLSFEQGDKSSFYLSEEILSTNEYSRTVKASDRATMLNLMVGLNGYTLCSGIICEELNGSDYLAIPFEGDEQNQNSDMEIGYITRKLLGSQPKKARIGLSGSFAATGRGHGTDRALVAGLLGMKPDDMRIPDSFSVAKQEGLEFEIYNTQIKEAHPNTALLDVEGVDGKTIVVQASSLGGGRIMLNELDEITVNCTGACPTLIIRNEDSPGQVAEVTSVLYGKKVNIATLQLHRDKRGGYAVMVIETDQPVEPDTIRDLERLNGISKVTYIETEGV